MPRRRALRVLGGALVGFALPATRAKAAPSTHDCPAQNAFLCACPSINGLFYKICCPNPTPTVRYSCECKAPPNGYAACRPVKTPCKRSCGEGKCCDEGEFCANPARHLCCKQGERVCGGGSFCCQPNEECVTARVRSSVSICVKRCPSGQAWCGDNKCCPPKWHCRNPATGLCKRCQPNEEECGKKCCNRRTSRCCGDAGCCPKNRSCCVTGKKQVCCPPRTKCAIPILPGNIGIKSGTEAICCPQERLSKEPQLCCPPGQVALNSPGMRIPPPGVSPFCCPRGQVCRGSGGTYCADFRSDPSNCGSCGNVCQSGICSGGICALP